MSTAKRKRNDQLPRLTPTEQQVMTFVLNAVALGTFKDTCSVEGIAEELGKNPARLNTTVRKLEEKGYVTLQGKALTWVYPTAEAMQAQDPELTEAGAKAMLRKLGLRAGLQNRS